MTCVLPPEVARLCHNQDAWIVGSAADPSNLSPRDWDVLVPFHMWHSASAVLPADAKPNSFGGWKFKSQADGVEIDIWPGDLGWLMQRPRSRFAWHPASNTRIVSFGKENA